MRLSRKSSRTSEWRSARRAAVIGTFAVAACARDDASGRTDESATQETGPLVVYNAGSLARPIKAALDTFAAREDVRVEQESAGSLETARKLTELGKIPD